MKLFSYKTSVADAIMHHQELINILERLNIPLGVREMTIKEIAISNQINPDLLLSLFNLQVYKLIDRNLSFTAKDANLIINYLKTSHQLYTCDFYPRISELINRLIEKNQQAEFKMLQHFYDEYRQEVEQHFNYENDTVFPYINQLIDDSKEDSQFLNYCVKDYKQHHNDIEEKLKDLKSLLVKFLPPADDTQIRRKTIQILTELNADLQIHARIENEILIPLVENLEKQKNG